MPTGVLTPVWEYSKSRDDDNRENEVFSKAIKYQFADGKKRSSPVVAYEHVTKHVANMKNGIYRCENPSRRIE